MLQNDVGMYLVGLFLRLGVPLGFTLFLAWLLRNIDLQWLEEANGRAHSPKSLDSQRSDGCWIHQNLTSETDPSHKPDECWKVRMKFEGVLPDECLDCHYFQEKILDSAA